MIFSDKFIWLHFPKCAGSKVESIFLKYFSNDKNIYQDVIDPTIDPIASWHDSIDARARRDSKFAWKGKTIISGFRKLPEWLLSRYFFELQRSPHLNHDPKLLFEAKFLEQDGQVRTPDIYSKFYFPEHIYIYEELKFIRTEYFKEDFKTIFGEFVDVSIIPDVEFDSLINPSKKTGEGFLISEIKKSENQIYEKCPHWQMIEQDVYSKSVLVESA